MVKMHANDFDLKIRKLILETTKKKKNTRTHRERENQIILAREKKSQLTFQSKD